MYFYLRQQELDTVLIPKCFNSETNSSLNMSDFHIWVQIICDGDNVKVKDISEFETGPYYHSAKNSILI